MLQKTPGQMVDNFRKLTFSEILERAAQVFAFLYAVAVALILFLSDKFGQVLGLNAQQIAASFVLLVAGFLLHFDRRLSAILNQTRTAPRQVTMRDAFDEVFARYSHVRQLRLYGSTTQLMVQWFEACHRRDEFLRVDECKVLAHDFVEADFPAQSSHYNTIRLDSFAKWKAFEAQNVIGSISFAANRVLPQTFLVVLDEKAAIIGTYVKRKNGPTGLLDLQPMVIYGANDSEKAIIRTYREWFDAWFAESTEVTLKP